MNIFIHKNRNGRIHKIMLRSKWGLAVAMGAAIIWAILGANPSAVYAAGSWDSALEGIHSLYADYTSLQEVIKDDQLNIRKLSKQNKDHYQALNKQLQAMDQEQLNRLKSEVEAIRKKHAPLLEQYTSLIKQSAAARQAKDMKTATLLDLKRNKLKSAVASARSEVNCKADALAAARKLTTAKKKPVKDELVAVTSLNKQISAESKKLTSAQKIRSQADKSYKASIKQGDAITAVSQMRLSYEQMGIIHSMQQQIYNWEVKISHALNTAESKLPK